MNAVRILYVTNRLAPAGAETFLLERLRVIDRERYEPHVAALRPGGALTDAFRSLDVPVHELGRDVQLDPLAWARLYGLMRRERFSLVEAHVWYACLAARVAGRMAGVRAIITNEQDVRMGMNTVRRDVLWAGDATTRLSHACVHITRASRRSFEGGTPKWLQGQVRREVIPNGVDVGSIHDVVTRLDRRRKREELGFFGDEIVLGNVARLQPAKGHTYLLESFAEVLKQEPRARLIAVGWGELEQPLRDKAVALGISHATQFLGRRLDVKELLGAMDAFVFSSIHEGQGIAILEAMAARLPIAATDVDGIPDMIRHEDTGLLVPPRDADALAAATLRLIRDKSLAQSLGRNAHAVAKAEFSIAPIGQRYEELYESLLGQRSPPHWS